MSMLLPMHKRDTVNSSCKSVSASPATFAVPHIICESFFSSIFRSSCRLFPNFQCLWIYVKWFNGIHLQRKTALRLSLLAQRYVCNVYISTNILVFPIYAWRVFVGAAVAAVAAAAFMVLKLKRDLHQNDMYTTYSF